MTRYPLCTGHDNYHTNLKELFPPFLYKIDMKVKISNTLDKVRVAYNNAFRAFMSVDRRSSVSAAFIQKGINHFNVLYRKAVYGFKSRLFECNNSIVQNVIQSPFFIYKSKLYTQWHDILYTNYV